MKPKALKKAVVPLRDSEALTGLIFISDLELGLNEPSLVAVCVGLMLNVLYWSCRKTHRDIQTRASVGLMRWGLEAENQKATVYHRA